MCGIFGLVTSNQSNLEKKDFLQITKKLFLFSESRGKEASGIAGTDGETIWTFKTPYTSSEMLQMHEYRSVVSKVFNNQNQRKAFIGHSRLVTDGYEHNDKNNQPVIKNNIILVHNGIIVNKNELWKEYQKEKKETDLDSELIPVILNKYISKNDNIENGFNALFNKIFGMTSIAMFTENMQNLFLSTNNGSLYFILDSLNTCLIFASERFILEQVIKTFKHRSQFPENEIKQIKPMEVISVSTKDISLSKIDISDNQMTFHNLNYDGIKNIIQIPFKLKKKITNTSLEHGKIRVPTDFINEFGHRLSKIRKIKRCINCLIPETFPLINFDLKGICSICSNYKKITVKGEEQLIEDIKPHLQTRNSNYDCLVALSGGRDSSYSLYFLKEKLGLNPLVFSYDWGMLTDLSRRNQSRVCGKLNIEHILVSADIRKKRRNIMLNVQAWLKNPTLGTIPLFMAGDKQYYYFSHLLKRQNRISLSIMGENHLEKTGFKILFSGARQTNDGFMSYHMTGLNKIRMLFYYAAQFVKNPAYLNRSIYDTAGAFLTYYFLPKNYLNIFDYIPWEESEIDNKIINFFDWETDPSTTTTWRIGDGTVAFYNYIYYMVAGFTENDTFRSNQIREGMLSRSDAKLMIEQENQPRWNAIKWYCDTINLNFENTIKIINSMQRLY